MAYTFDDLRRDVLKDVKTNPEFFGEQITYKTTDPAAARQFNVHCKHSLRFIFDAEGNEIAIESITVILDKRDLPDPPKTGDLIYRGNDDCNGEGGFLYAYGGGDEEHHWRRVFERRRLLSKGS